MGEGAEVGIFRALHILWERHVASSGDHMLARDIKPDHLRAEAFGERGSSPREGVDNVGKRQAMLLAGSPPTVGCHRRHSASTPCNPTSAETFPRSASNCKSTKDAALQQLRVQQLIWGGSGRHGLPPSRRSIESEGTLHRPDPPQDPSSRLLARPTSLRTSACWQL